MCNSYGYIQPITKSQDYKDFCESNGYMTAHKTPQPQKKAETLYRYLTNNTDFNEEHTGLEDSLIELEILITALGLLEQSTENNEKNIRTNRT